MFPQNMKSFFVLQIVCIRDGKILNTYKQSDSEFYSVAVNSQLSKVCVGLDEVVIFLLLCYGFYVYFRYAQHVLFIKWNIFPSSFRAKFSFTTSLVTPLSKVDLSQQMGVSQTSSFRLIVNLLPYQQPKNKSKLSRHLILK